MTYDWIDKFHEENSVVEPTPAADWMNSEQGDRIPSDPNELRNFKINKGTQTAHSWLQGIRLDDFKSMVGPMVESLEPGEPVPLDNSLWVDAIKQYFHNEPTLELPEPFALPNDDTELFQYGFNKEIRRILRLALTWGKND